MNIQGLSQGANLRHSRSCRTIWPLKFNSLAINVNQDQNHSVVFKIYWACYWWSWLFFQLKKFMRIWSHRKTDSVILTIIKNSSDLFIEIITIITKINDKKKLVYWCLIKCLNSSYSLMPDLSATFQYYLSSRI